MSTHLTNIKACAIIDISEYSLISLVRIIRRMEESKMDKREIVIVDQVKKTFGKKCAIDSISLSVSQSEIYGLLGPSGAGKTTLVKMIAGIDQPTSGAIEVLGVKMPNLHVMKRVGYMAQLDALYGELTALENLEFFAAIYGLKGAVRRKRILEVMELVNLTSDLKRIVNNYSGGMKRRLSLAASLLHRPELLLLDEPTVGIDPVLRVAIWDELNQLSRDGTTIVITTHVMDEAEKCHRLGMLRDGNLIAVGTPQQLKEETNTNTIEEAFLIYGGVKR